MDPRRTSGRRSAGARKPALRSFPYGSSQRPRPLRPARGGRSVQLRAGGAKQRGSKLPRRGLAGLAAAGRQRPARSPFEKASGRLASRRQRKQSAGRGAAVATIARGLVSKESARSKKEPAVRAMAAAGAVGGVAARFPFEKASGRLASRRERKQSGGRGAAVATLARGLMSQGTARGSKKRPAALAMAGAGAAGGIALARRRKAGAADAPEIDPALNVSSEPVEPEGARAEGGTSAPHPAA